MSVSRCFERLRIRLQPTAVELATLDRHGVQIVGALRALQLHSTKALGSHQRGTAIARRSDRDVFAVFHRREAIRGGTLISSETMLDRVRSALLNSRFWSTDVVRDGQAIVLRFSDGRNVDVVPALFEGMEQVLRVNRPVYSIPDGDGWWMATSPEAHLHYIRQAHAPSGGKFRYCIQLLKAWRESRDPRIPISSFHLELVFANEGTFSQVGTYQECLRDAFRVLRDRAGRAIQDPLGISGNVRAAKTPRQVALLRDHAAYAYDKADQAIAAEIDRDLPSAWFYWNLVFNDTFPAL